MNEPVDHGYSNPNLGERQFSSRADGTFAWTEGPSRVWSLWQQAPLHEYPEGSLRLWPEVGGPVDAALLHAGRLDRAAAIGGSMLAVGVMPEAEPGCHPRLTQLYESSKALYARDPGCDQPEVEIFRETPGGLTLAERFGLPFRPRHQHLFSRDGGYWYVAAGWRTLAFPLDEQGSSAGEAIVVDENPFGAPALAQWRSGFALLRRQPSEIQLTIDEAGIQRSTPPLGLTYPSLQTPAVVVGGPGGRSILAALFAHARGNDYLVLVRADCQD